MRTTLAYSLNLSLRRSVSTAVLSGMIEMMTRLRESPPDMETLRFYLIFPLHPAFADPANAREIHFTFAEKCLALKGAAWKCFEKWLTYSPVSWLENIIVSDMRITLAYSLNLSLRRSVIKQPACHSSRPRIPLKTRSMSCKCCCSSSESFPASTARMVTLSATRHSTSLR